MDLGLNMDYGTAFVIDFLKRRKPQEFYDHRTAKLHYYATNLSGLSTKNIASIN